MVRLIIMLAAMAMSLSACSFFSPVPNANKTYLVNTLPQNVAVHRGHNGTMMVATPDSVPIYNTVDMAYTTSPYQIAYFAKSTWAETPGQMLKPLLVETLHKTHHYRVVTSTETAGQSDYVLHTQIVEFRQVFFMGSSDVHFKMAAQIVKTNSGQVIANKLFYVVEPAPENSPFGGVVAANHATAEMLRQVAKFCVRRT
jgi:cholesterol transport system auxiliary component